MTEIPDEAVDAGSRVAWFEDYGNMTGYDSPENLDRVNYDDRTLAILKAAMPHIRAQIAAEIRAIPIGDFRTYDCLPSDYANMGRAGMKEKAARIAEGSGE
ncbi:hypothetical protein U6G28_08890 [Actinomycetaceae bacterium MB13-C1-2]|nr:hypothetical protein U6G28_08890 [Actinomycetaceae bacterium MB13-C1-2]